jgi:hypothetical protein
MAQRRDSGPVCNPEENQSLSQPMSWGAMTRLQMFAANNNSAQVVARICGGTAFCNSPRIGPM